MSPRLVIGVDPGIGGAIAAVNVSTRGAVVYDMPVVEVQRGRKTCREVHPAGAAALFAALRNQDPSALVVMERVGAMPGQGVTSMFSFGRSTGVLEGAIAAAGLPLRWAAPQSWRKAMQVRGGKDGARLRASELLPAASHYFARKSDHGRADAALLALSGLAEGDRL